MKPPLSPNEAYLRSITEKQWQRIVEGVAEVGGWLVYHAPDNRPVTSGRGRRYVQAVRAGFPDLVLVRGGRLVVVELKTMTGRVSPEQSRWLAELRNAGVEVAVWRPSDERTMESVLLHGERIETWPRTAEES